MDPDWVDVFPKLNMGIFQPAIAMLRNYQRGFLLVIQIHPWRHPYPNHNYPILREVIYFREKTGSNPNPKKHQWGPTSIVPSFYFLRKNPLRLSSNSSKAKKTSKNPNWAFELTDFRVVSLFRGLFLITRKVFFVKNKSPNSMGLFKIHGRFVGI